MFDIGSTELLLIAVVAIVVIGPKDLPRVLYHVGKFMGQAKGMARHFRSGLDAMIREAELEELEKKWAAENKRIMEEHPPEQVGSPVGPPAPVGGVEPHPANAMPQDTPPASAAPAIPAPGPAAPYAPTSPMAPKPVQAELPIEPVAPPPPAAASDPADHPDERPA